MNLYNNDVDRRVSGTTEQLKQYFKKDQYLTKAMLNEIQANLGMDEKCVRKWFCNRRHKIKKEKGYVKSTIISLSCLLIYFMSTLVQYQSDARYNARTF